MIQTIPTSKPEAWQEIIKKSIVYDFYHTADYHKISEENGEGVAELIVFSQGSFLICLPLLFRKIAVFPECDFYDATSVYGYAGPLSNQIELPKQVIDDFCAELKEFLKNKRIVSVFSRMHPLLEQAEILSPLGEILPISKTVSIDTKLSEEEQWMGYRKGHRYDIKQLIKNGFSVARHNDLSGLDNFSRIYEQTMDRVGAAEMYYFPKKYYRQLLLSKDYEAFILSVYRDLKIVSSGIFIKCGEILQYHLSGTDANYLKQAPTKLLLDEARKIAVFEGLKHFHLGGGIKDEDALFAFKAGFSSKYLQFCIWKYIVDEEVYRELCAKQFQGNIPKNNYFPLYRTICE